MQGVLHARGAKCKGCYMQVYTYIKLSHAYKSLTEIDKVVTITSFVLCETDHYIIIHTHTTHKQHMSRTNINIGLFLCVLSMIKYINSKIIQTTLVRSLQSLQLPRAVSPSAVQNSCKEADLND